MLISINAESSNIQGLDLKIGEGNKVEISSHQKFSRSKIYVEGFGNEILIDHSLSFDNLFINIKGTNKKITIESSLKKIFNLKIVSIRGDSQSLHIGKDFSCGGCEIQFNDGGEGIVVGENCLFSWGIKIRASDGHTILDNLTNKVLNLPKNVSIGNHVWVCEDVKILKGVNIPSGCVIASGSIVTKSFSVANENSILAGSPAVIVRQDISWVHQNPVEYVEMLK